ncbi:uncharacterized protein TRUGW13939_09721 [Talaromyces rugulosus]|uniref:Uncharacterized protein n=1 Tax=Talaromyces rugulosus TaxID=121627 RepID=A0A7H8R850_TALRU|nr:uncharacterized protein TRUGW13939_09721 [Talaromyces rugulosus]QKX62560.1 hypothetical protein TRUGW13939_09721 [Talaromyces rugulosus]
MVVDRESLPRLRYKNELRIVLKDTERRLEKRFKASQFTEWQKNKKGTCTIKIWRQGLNAHKKGFHIESEISLLNYLASVLHVEQPRQQTETEDITEGLRILFLELLLQDGLGIKGDGLPWFLSISPISSFLVRLNLDAIPPLANHLCAFSTKVSIQTTFNGKHVEASLPTVIKRMSMLRFCPDSHIRMKNLLNSLEMVDWYQNMINMQLPYRAPENPYQTRPSESLKSFPDNLELPQPRPFPPNSITFRTSPHIGQPVDPDNAQAQEPGSVPESIPEVQFWDHGFNAHEFTYVGDLYSIVMD